MHPVGDAVHADYLTWQIETGDAASPRTAENIGFKATRANRKNGLEIVMLTVKVIGFFVGSIPLDDVVELLHLTLIECDRQA